MGFESCHPAVNFLFFAAALYGAVRFDHPVFLAIAYVSAFAYSVRRCGKRRMKFPCPTLPRFRRNDAKSRGKLRGSYIF